MAKDYSTKLKQTTVNKKKGTSSGSGLSGIVLNAVSAVAKSGGQTTATGTNTLVKGSQATPVKSKGANQTITSGAARYDTLYDNYATAADKRAEQNKAQTAAEYNEKLKQAYVSQAQNQRNLNNNLMQAGIRGGASESSMLNLANTYQNTRNSLNSEKATALQKIDTENEANKLEYKINNDTARLQYMENRESEARSRAQTLADEKRTRKQEIQTAAWTNKYSTYYSIKDLKAARKKAKTKEERSIINARIGYIRAHKKEY